MSVDAGSSLAREWAREEIKKLQRLDLAELEHEERQNERRCVGFMFMCEVYSLNGELIAECPKLRECPLDG